MQKLVTASALAALFAVAPAHAAIQTTVANVGAVLNESLSLPAESTPGSGIGFQEFFEFTLPVSETVTVSVTDSATGLQRVVGGVLELNNWTGNGAVSPFVPTGSLIEASAFTNFVGGQGATVGPDILGAGAYFAEVSGTSGVAALHIAVDSTVTATPVPEPKTWAMGLIGFGLIGAIGYKRARTARYAMA